MLLVVGSLCAFVTAWPSLFGVDCTLERFVNSSMVQRCATRKVVVLGVHALLCGCQENTQEQHFYVGIWCWKYGAPDEQAVSHSQNLNSGTHAPPCPDTKHRGCQPSDPFAVVGCHIGASYVLFFFELRVFV